MRRIDGARADAVEAVDLGPLLAAIGRTIESAESVRRAAPAAVDAHVPRALRRVVRVNQNVFGPVTHARVAAIQPRRAAVRADEDAGAGRERARRIAPPRIGAD